MTEAEWWISDGHLRDGGTKILGPFVSRELALEVRTLFEAHPRAKGRTYWVSKAPEQRRPVETTRKVNA